MKSYYVIAVICMAIFTYIPRFIPLTFYRKKIKSRYIRSILYYLPYAALEALTFPGVFSATPHLVESLAGVLTAVLLAYKGKGLVVCAVSSIVVCYIVNFLLTIA